VKEETRDRVPGQKKLREKLIMQPVHRLGMGVIRMCIRNQLLQYALFKSFL
jgi:hypothetical protein